MILEPLESLHLVLSVREHLFSHPFGVFSCEIDVGHIAVALAFLQEQDTLTVYHADIGSISQVEVVVDGGQDLLHLSFAFFVRIAHPSLFCVFKCETPLVVSLSTHSFNLLIIILKDMQSIYTIIYLLIK